MAPGVSWHGVFRGHGMFLKHGLFQGHVVFPGHGVSYDWEQFAVKPLLSLAEVPDIPLDAYVPWTLDQLTYAEQSDLHLVYLGIFVDSSVYSLPSLRRQNPLCRAKVHSLLLLLQLAIEARINAVGEEEEALASI